MQDRAGRLPSLDGLRAVSILMVLSAHLAGTEGMPAWLSQRSLDVVFAIRQGRGYAAFGGDGGGACGADLEVLAAPSGKSCGCLKVPHLTREASVGRDGSLMVPGLSTSCSYDLYPKLFR